MFELEYAPVPLNNLNGTVTPSPVESILIADEPTATAVPLPALADPVAETVFKTVNVDVVGTVYIGKPDILNAAGARSVTFTKDETVNPCAPLVV